MKRLIMIFAVSLNTVVLLSQNVLPLFCRVSAKDIPLIRREDVTFDWRSLNYDFPDLCYAYIPSIEPQIDLKTEDKFLVSIHGAVVFKTDSAGCWITESIDSIKINTVFAAKNKKCIYYEDQGTITSCSDVVYSIDLNKIKDNFLLRLRNSTFILEKKRSTGVAFALVYSF